MNKIENILSFWLSCVREQDIQKTELHHDINPDQFISLENDDAVASNQRDSVKIDVSDKLHKILKNQKKSLVLRNNSDSRPVFFFPLIELKGRLSPLFFVDLTDYEKDILSDSNDKSFEINPWSIDTKIGVVTDTFVRLGYDEDHINLDDSIISFIESITGEFTLNFTIAMDALLNYISKDYKEQNKGAGLPFFKTGVLKYSDFSDATLIFKKDLLSFIESEELRSEKVFKDFLYRIETKPEKVDTFYHGAFRPLPLSSGQADVLSILQKNDEAMVAVQGPPGTGKTFMIMSAIASQITQRAIAIAENKPFDSKPILATSFTNKAVENIEELMEEFYGDRIKNLIFLALGNKEKRALAANKLNNAIQFLSEEKFDSSLYKNIKSILKNHSVLFKSDDTNEGVMVERSALSAFRDAFGIDFNDVSGADEFLEKLSSHLNVEPSLSFILREIKNKQFHLREKNKDLAIRHLRIKKSCKLYNEIIGKYKSQDFKRLLMDERFYKKDHKDTLINCTPEEDVGVIHRILQWFAVMCGFKKKSGITKGQNELEKVKNHIKLKRLEPLYLLVRQAKEIQRESHNVTSMHNKLIRCIDKLESMNLSENTSGPQNFRLKYAEVNHKLFDLSLQLIVQHALSKKEEILPIMKEWVSQIDPSKSVKVMEDAPSKIHSIGAVYPLITCTLSSISNILHADEPSFQYNKMFSLAICDEAGMVPIYCMPTLIIRSQKILVVGDQKQLSPVVAIDKNRIDEFYSRYKINDDDGLYHPLKASAFQRSSFCVNDSFKETGNSIILDEHRRCVTDISNCFIDIAQYSGLVNKTNINTHKEMLFNKTFESPLSFVDVKGEKSNRRNVNFSEIHKIKSILLTLKASGVDITKQVGIITPFQNQSICLQNELRELVNHTFSNKKIGTIHAFQGTEFDIIIISLVVFNDSFNVSFIDKKPNMLNVAVSRARYRVITVGDGDFLSTLSGNISKLLAHSEHLIE